MTARMIWFRDRKWQALHAPKVKFFSLLAVLLAGVVPLATCGGGSGSPAAGTVTAVTISPAAASVALNQFVDFTANVTFSTSTTPVSTAVTWEVNGIAGGNSTIGTIVPSATDVQVGVYTAPSVAPTTNNGQVSITAVAPQVPSSTTNSNTVTSNTATVTIAGGTGLVVGPPSASIAAGSNFGFSAMLNSEPDMNATWTVSSTNGGDIGTIDAHTGVYSAPDFPPPGAVITITAMDAGATASTTATIVYSDASLQGPFAFSYTGNDSDGFLAVAGSFVADGQGGIISGVEDIQSFSTGISTQVQIRGNYVVGPDGRTNATLNSGLSTASTLQFALTNNTNNANSLHGLLIRFDKNATGGGTIDQQNLNALTNSDLVISGPYVFSALGTDAAFKPLGIAGRFVANEGQIMAGNSSVDVNDNGAIASNTDLVGTYSFDPQFPGTGRGTLTLTSSIFNTQRKFAFYIVDSTHLQMVEVDGNSFLAGEVFSGSIGNTFTNSSLAAANYAFTAGGMSPTGIYAAGGIFTSDGNGNTTAGGAFDSNNAGTVQSNTTINICTYTINSTTGRIDLRLNTGAGTCPVGSNPNTLEYALYQTAQGSAVMLELDPTSVSAGMAFQQQATPSLGVGGFALNLVGQGLLHNAPASIQQDVEGALILSSSAVTKGTLDINNFGAVFPNNPLNGTGAAKTSSFTAPAANGRGTAVLAASDPGVTYNLSYYLIDNNTALLLDQDNTIVAIGKVDRQF